jgi:hypothetical protein
VPPLRLARKRWPVRLFGPLETSGIFREPTPGECEMRGKLSEPRATPLDPPCDATGAEPLGLHLLIEAESPAFGHLRSPVMS